MSARNVMSKDEFTAMYAKDSDMEVREILQMFEPIRCACDERCCKGWQMASRMDYLRDTESDGGTEP